MVASYGEININWVGVVPAARSHIVVDQPRQQLSYRSTSSLQRHFCFSQFSSHSQATFEKNKIKLLSRCRKTGISLDSHGRKYTEPEICSNYPCPSLPVKSFLIYES